jgi:hypothetical protein
MVLSIYTFIVDCLNSVSIWIESNSDFVTAAATIAIAFFTWTLYRATRKLWKVSQEQSRDMKDSLAIAQEAADAAKDSARVARDTLTSTRRAFISLKSITAEQAMIYRGLDGHQEAQHWMFSPCWVNMGDTPTKNLSISINWKVFDYEIPKAFDFPYDNKSNATTNIPMAIGPKCEVICGAFALHYLRILDPIMGLQNSNLYIWGEAIYDDIFDNPHCTRFCVKMIFLTQQIVGGHNNPTFIFYDRYNCYDDDCDKQS